MPHPMTFTRSAAALVVVAVLPFSATAAPHSRISRQTGGGTALVRFNKATFRRARRTNPPRYPIGDNANLARLFNPNGPNLPVSIRTFDHPQVQESLSSLPSPTYEAMDSAVGISATETYRPTHPDDANAADRDLFYSEFNHVLTVQRLRERGILSSAIFPQHSLFPAGETIGQSACRVFDDFPTDFPTELIQQWIAEEGLGSRLDPEIFEHPNCIAAGDAGAEFVNGFVALGELIGWAVRTVSPAAFATKWHVGRARPEEVAQRVAADPTFAGDRVSTADRQWLRGQGVHDTAAEFTEYVADDNGRICGNQVGATFGSGGSPVHPSYPAMHSAASSASTWLEIVANLTPEMKESARLLDFSISYFRTMAGVHYESDNRAGLAIGQYIIQQQLPTFLAESYGCDEQSRADIRAAAEAKVAAIDLDWSTWLPDGWTDPSTL